MDTNAFIIHDLAYEHLAATLTCIGDGIISTDLEGRLVFMNKSAEELTGWNMKEALGKNVNKILPVFDGDDEIFFDNPIKNVITSGVVIGYKNDSYFISKEGNKLFISASCSPNIDFEGKTTGAVIVFRDVTRLKQVDEDLRIERNNFQEIFEASPMGIAIVNSDLIIGKVNSAFLKVFNKKFEEVINKKTGDILYCMNSFRNPDGCGFSEGCELCKIRSIVTRVIEDKMMYVEKDIKFNQLYNGIEVSPWLDVNFVPINISGVTNVMLVLEDVTEQKQYKTSLEESRDFYISSFENFPGLVWRTNKQQKVDYFNKAWLKFTGRTMEEEITINWKEKIHQEDAEKYFKTWIEKSELHEAHEIEYRLKTKEGNYRWIWERSSPIHDMRGEFTGFIGVCDDITDRKIAEEGLNRYQMLSKQAVDIILFINSRGKIVDANDAAISVYGYTREELLTLSINDLRRTSLNLEDSIEKMEIAGELYESINYRKDGTSFPIEINAQSEIINGERITLSIIRDISDRKKIENEIKESKAKYQSLFMNMNTGFAYFHILFADNEASMDLEFIEVNSKFEELFNVVSSEIRGRTIKEMFPDIWERYNYGLRTIGKKELTSEHHHIPEYYDDVAKKWYSISSFQTGFSYYASLVSDITESKESESELKRAKEAAEAANKAKSQFLANMSHEIRTPLNGMLGMIDLTINSDLNDDQRDNLKIAKSCSNSLLKVINDILDFSKMEAGKLTIENIWFNIRDLIEDIVKVHTIRAQEKGLNLLYQLSSAIPENLIGDPSRLKQILNNLIGNAIKFTENGNVSISIKKYSRDGDFLELLFAVADTGIGIAKGKLDLLFKSFSQVDSSYTRKFGGTGLGLVISKQLIEMMGGKIWNESSESNGSIFFFTIKLEVGEKKEVYKPEIIPEYINNSTYNILCVEDERVNQMVIDYFLKDKGHKITFANNGREAVVEAEKNDFDIILMDIQLPEMDGIQATAEIRRREALLGRHTPIIALTAYALKGDREKFLSLGMDEYISKPVDSKILFEFIERFGSKAEKLKPKATNKLKVDILDTRDKIVKDSIEIGKIKEEIYKQLGLLKNAYKGTNIIAIENIAHQIKVLASKIDELPIKNQSFKIELASRREDLSEVKETIRLLEKEIIYLKLKGNK